MTEEQIKAKIEELNKQKEDTVTDARDQVAVMNTKLQELVDAKDNFIRGRQSAIDQIQGQIVAYTEMLPKETCCEKED